jgi:hypothetical protein
LPRSACHAAWYVSSRAARRSISLSASIHWIACLSASREPNVSRSFAHSTARSSDAWATPMFADEYGTRPCTSQVSASAKPSPSSPIRCSTGTSQSCSEISYG